VQRGRHFRDLLGAEDADHQFTPEDLRSMSDAESRILLPVSALGAAFNNSSIEPAITPARAVRRATFRASRPSSPDPRRIKVFATDTVFERWLSAHHDVEPEVWIKVDKISSGLASVTPAQALDVSLCWGWSTARRARSSESGPSIAIMCSSRREAAAEMRI
jgi:hypothetical protein